MGAIDWDSLELGELAALIRSQTTAPDAERTIWAFEQALAAARLDPALLDYLLIAVVCLRARADDTSPREVLESFFRRSVASEDWRRRYRPLLA